MNKGIDLDRILDTVKSMSPEKLEKTFEDFELAKARAAAKEADEQAKESDIERITLFFAGGQTALLVKPNPMTKSWLLNLYGNGTITIPEEATVNFEVRSHFGELHRFSMEYNELTYWNDLIDSKMAQELAEFLKVPMVRVE
ncbi:hypothetical protein R7D97_21535 [Vibrio sp. Vb5031]|uniref:hypothetical protein n=1 Tax=Vibrio TaxID=662 RepID=UPI00265AD3F1|nr:MULTISPECIES: hypothetical protein [Vibrio]ELA9084659.1 hypothetical protein [Vibrio alginolyticus]MCR9545015.1 hypothetical protein [Vibrio antiquarius]MDW1506777.1 hypothetical protein [Vibrio sp. Vb5031]